MKNIIRIVLVASFALSVQNGFAGSATWNLNPTSGDWNTAANWTPNTIPNGSNDTATFATSSITVASLSATTEVSSVIFNSGASAYTITDRGLTFTISGVGITNTSGIVQHFVVGPINIAGYAYLNFTNSATAGALTAYDVRATTSTGYNAEIIFNNNSTAGSGNFTVEGNAFSVASPALYFFDTSNLGNANVTLGGATANGAYGGVVSFFGNANAGSGTVTVNGGNVAGAFGAFAIFEDNSDALGATLNINGGLSSGATGGTVRFNSSSTATGSILVANAGSDSASGGRIEFLADSTGDTAQVRTFGNGTLDISGHNLPGVAVGSIEGSGVIDLGGQGLTVGSNNLSTTFSGILEDGDGATGGSLTKIGSGTLTLSGANTYTGPTIVNDGVLLLRKPKGAGATNIMGAVRVPFGTLAGNGKISGTVWIGDGSGTGSVLAPGLTGVGQLTIGGKLSFFSDSTYDCDLDSSTLKSDRVTGNRVAIAFGTHFSLTDLGNRTLAPGVLFTIISNTSSKPIAGVFANLFDGGTITAGSNTFQASYEGGDGNDLTLTVIQ